MRPSFVRSKVAPQASSSRTRAGASCACSSAIRQLLTYWPPRMVSAKWTRQSSRSSTLARAAAMPPSAITVCALPRRDLHTRPTETPAAEASMAARSPAPPAPMTSTSCRCVSGSATLEEPRVVPDAHREHAHVEVGEAHREEAQPGPAHVPAVERACAAVGGAADARASQLVAPAAHEVAQRVAAQRVAAEEDHVHGQHERAQADAEGDAARHGIGEPHRLPDVVEKDDEEHQGEVEEVAVDVLQDERERALAEVALAWLAHRARRRIGPECLVVRAAVVVAGHAEAAGGPQDEQGGRERQRHRPPCRPEAEPPVLSEEEGRVE